MQEGQSRKIVTDADRQQRRESRRNNTMVFFLKDLAQYSSLPQEELGKAAASVLCALEQRLSSDEVKDLESQLPANLRDLLVRCERHEGNPSREFALGDLYDMVCEDLGMRQEDVPPVVRAVFRALKDQISEGESEDVAAQLPADIKEVWWNA